MVAPLFPNFLHDEREYASAERSWRDLWERIRDSRQSLSHWHEPWLTTSYLNGKPFLDGDPIFSAISETDKRAIRVIQHEAESHELEVDFWAETFGDDDDKIDVLVIDCALCEASMHVA